MLYPFLLLLFKFYTVPHILFIPNCFPTRKTLFYTLYMSMYADDMLIFPSDFKNCHTNTFIFLKKHAEIWSMLACDVHCPG